jgi:CheY-like chemotaxis protein
VEDDSIIRLDLEETLRGFGFGCVVGASNLEAAAALAGTLRIRFAVLDYEVGHSTTADLASLLVAKGVPVIFLTAHAGGIALPPALAHVQVIAKPFSSALLAEALLRALEERGPMSIPCIGLTG